LTIPDLGGVNSQIALFSDLPPDVTALSSDISFIDGANRSIILNQNGSGNGDDLTVRAGDAAAGTFDGGDLVLQPGLNGGGGADGFIVLDGDATFANGAEGLLAMSDAPTSTNADDLRIQGGDAVTTGFDGGNIVLDPGIGVGAGVDGIVQVLGDFDVTGILTGDGSGLTGISAGFPQSAFQADAGALLDVTNSGTGGSAIFDISNGTNASAALVSFTNGTGPAASFDQGNASPGQNIAEFRDQGVNVVTIDDNGTVTATAFSGNGAGLTGVPANVTNLTSDISFDGTAFRRLEVLDATAAFGAGLTIEAGDGDGAGNDGGGLNINAGNAGTSSGASGGGIVIFAGSGDGGGFGGQLDFNAGAGFNGATGGDAVFSAGSGFAGGNGGNVVLNPGSGAANGNIQLNGDAAIGTGAVVGASGSIAIGGGTTTANANTIVLGDGIPAYDVGIGTNTPQGPLDVNLASGTAYFEADNTNNFGTIQISNADISDAGDASIRFGIPGDLYVLGIDNSDNDAFKINAGSILQDGVANFAISAAGDVGIGTSSPFNKLTVREDVAGGAVLLRLQNEDPNATSDVAMSFDGDAAVYSFGMDATDDVLKITNAGNVSAGTELLTVDNVGNLNVAAEVRTPLTGTANMLPIAIATVDASGGLLSFSSNVASAANVGPGQYDVEINGEDFTSFDAYVIQTTILGATPGSAYILPVGTSLRVAIIDPAGNPQDAAFSVVVYEP
jgi:hypothetical protein